MKNFNLEDVVINNKSSDIAKEILGGEIVIVVGFATVGCIKAHPRGFVYDVYDLPATWNESKAEFDVNCLRDGGICVYGDHVDATNSFISMIETEEQRG